MILIDMNQISVASVMMHLHLSKSKEVDENVVRHMILNSLRMYRTRFSSEFNELVLCYDSKHYWRRDYFPEYKSGRRKTREKSNHDWDAIFLCLNQIKDELRDNMPYKFLEIYGAEADDIIGALCSEYSEEIMIISGDKDFIQLQKFPNVKQYSPINDEVKRNYQRNRKLIDLTYTPDELSMEIISTYKEAPFGDRSKILNYFMQNRLRNLTESIGEF